MSHAASKRSRSEKILIASRPDNQDRAILAWQSIASAWPDGAAPPEPLWTAIDDVLEFEIAADSLLLLVAPAAESVSSRLLATLAERGTPVLVLSDVPQARASRGGVLVDSLTRSPQHLASCLWAMSQRQPIISRLGTELRAERRVHGGMDRELSQIHEELGVAAGIQRDLLPLRMPDVPGWDFGVLFRPAGYVSGDIYDVAQIDDRRVAFFLGDAVGHGVPAALLTTIIIQTVRGSNAHPHADSAEHVTRTMQAINAQLANDAVDSVLFVTAVFGVVDIHTGEVTLSVGGHPPPYLLRGAQRTAVEGGGPLLGVFAEATYESMTVSIDSGQTLLLYSDGFETVFHDAAEPSKSKSSEEYIAHIANAFIADTDANRCLDDAISDLREQIDAERGSFHQADDLTVLAIAPRPVAAKAAA